eukprot:g33464.t1
MTLTQKEFDIDPKDYGDELLQVMVRQYFPGKGLRLHADSKEMFQERLRLPHYQGQEPFLFLVLFFQNTLQSNDWKDGFSYFTEFVMGGLAISGRSYTLEVLHCNDTLDAAPRIQRCVDMAQTESVDALVVGSSSWNKEIKSAAEPYGIPNLHCSGGNPAIWTPVSDFGFGFHLPFTWYPEQAIRQAVLENLRSAVIIRHWAEMAKGCDSEDAFLGSAARAAAESLFRSSGVVGQLRVVGPSLEWCDRWQNVTSCSVQQGRCCCDDEVETATWLSFYEVAESKVVEPGFDSGAQFVSPALVSFVEGIIEESDGEQEEHVMRNIVELILCHLDLLEF